MPEPERRREKPVRQAEKYCKRASPPEAAGESYHAESSDVGFASFWQEDRQGVPRVQRRPARKKLQSACRRSTAWIQANRHVSGNAFFNGLNARLRGHDRDDGLHGNATALSRVFAWAMNCASQWRNRRGGKRRSVSWQRFTQLLDAVPIERPCMTEVRPRRVFA